MTPILVGMTGFEPAASRSRTVRSTKLSYIPKKILFQTTSIILQNPLSVKKKIKIFPVFLDCDKLHSLSQPKTVSPVRLFSDIARSECQSVIYHQH